MRSSTNLVRTFVSHTLCQQAKIFRVLRIILVVLPEHLSDTKVLTMKMEILLEPTSNKLLVENRQVGPHGSGGSGPDWLFDIDALTRTMNYEPIVAGTQSNGFAGTKASDNAGQARKKT
ncbi:hypothetical protein Tco_0909898, partial [Tanacetum coccineum]